MQDFFFENLKENQTGQHLPEYSFVSPCWGEANFVKVFGAPIVFRHMELDEETGKYMMRYAGSKAEVFDPSRLYVDEDGLLLHDIDSHEHLTVGSFDTNLACELAENLVELAEDAADSAVHGFNWQGQTYRLTQRAQI